jgi:hypothetical protein
VEPRVVQVDALESRGGDVGGRVGPRRAIVRVVERREFSVGEEGMNEEGDAGEGEGRRRMGGGGDERRRR